MATKIQTFALESGGTVAVEVAASGGEEERISSSKAEIVEDTGRKFTDALKGVEEATREILEGFATALKPEQLELTFGLKFSAKAGIVLASTDAEATLSLKATWKPISGS
ncbi:CU044_2847 family protein [Paracoccus sp. MBLB3053]|uniref:CU044_2847 family protein n=1 Tax=Paracoccus aurantius TaxID=3073814 RepID=A0ABU2HPV9_9RHOB|nr:CU044_2847 family protein [Paracoccus sp. MBLB3053]MDS9467082.1 CU044_2847 family protein [Paracoccus sp. MBLB3053]